MLIYKQVPALHTGPCPSRLNISAAASRGRGPCVIRVYNRRQIVLKGATAARPLLSARLQPDTAALSRKTPLTTLEPYHYLLSMHA